jgi:anion-transporting  ArsA/GET3 family ATPase
VTNSLSELIAKQKLLICVGSGGVGKTTMAATLGLRAAKEGRKTLVLTIDPAKRLANSLGLDSFGNKEAQVDIGDASGELWAMMLDTKTTFDELIKKSAPDDETRESILNNRIYRTLSKHFSGSQDYMAGEALYDIVESDRYDLVILDTPPAKNALDFLEASHRLAQFLDPRVIRFFLVPYKERPLIGRFMMGTSNVVFRLLGFVFGKEFLSDFSSFLRSFEPMFEGFRKRHEAVVSLLREKSTSFLVVCAPNEPSVEVALFFGSELERRSLPRAGFIVNQVLPSKGVDLDAEVLLQPLFSSVEDKVDDSIRTSFLEGLTSAHRVLRQHAHIEQQLIQQIRSMMHADDALREVPRLEGEVHDLAALEKTGMHLFGKQNT